jgi:hypothetical protein
VKKPVAKAAVKPVAKKPTAKKADTKVAAKPKAAARPAPKAVGKSAAKVVAKAAPKVATKVTVAKGDPKVQAKVAPAKTAPEATPAKAAKASKAAAGTTQASSAKATKESKAAAAAESIPALDANVKRPAKPFFMEVKPGVERVIKRGDKTAMSQAIDLQARRKGPTAEESSEELAERIERELQSQSFMRRTPMRRQMCTKCGINAVTPRFTIDRELGYCESCAEILRLGETKEAKRMEFNLSVKKEEGEAGVVAAPAEDAEEAEEDAVPDEEIDE